MSQDILFKSPRDVRYNCIAWALADDKRWWWPIGAYWPPQIPSDLTIDSFTQAFALFGYEPCDSALLEADFEKVALYMDMKGKPTHAARQLSDGRWASKLGKNEDIEHSQLPLPINYGYGLPIKFYRRLKTTARH